MNYLSDKGLIATGFFLYAAALTTWISYKVFDDITLITTQAAAAYSAYLAIPPLAVGLYKWRVDK